MQVYLLIYQHLVLFILLQVYLWDTHLHSALFESGERKIVFPEGPLLARSEPQLDYHNFLCGCNNVLVAMIRYDTEIRCEAAHQYSFLALV